MYPLVKTNVLLLSVYKLTLRSRTRNDDNN